MSFEARYRGRCASHACDRPIQPGDQIVYIDELLFHDECALDGPAPEPPVRRICDDCFTEVSMNGSCSC